MQSIELNKPSINIIDNNVSQNTIDICNEVANLQQQVSKLNEIIKNIESTIQLKDLELENIHREKNKLLAEFKKQQRCNRNLKQQLADERSFYQKEKDHFAEEMQRCRSRYISSNMPKFQQRRFKELEQTQNILELENKQFREELANKSEITYNLCIKFLRMKHAKDTLRYKLDKLLHEHLLVMAEMMEKLDEARNELNLIVSEKFQNPLPLSKAKFLQVVQRNNRLIYENATLNIQVHQLTQNIEKLKNNIPKPKRINIDAKIIEKLSQNSIRSTPDKTRKIDGFSRLSKFMDHSGENVDNYDLDNQNIKINSKEFKAECGRNITEIVETSVS